MAHLLLVLYRTHATRAMTGQLYHDTQATIRATFHCVVKAKEHCPAQPVFLWQLGTDGLENSFAIVRTLTHARNCDAKELGGRLGATVSPVEIWSVHPYWASISRRLHACTAHMNVRSWEPGGDDNCSVRDVVSCWRKGSGDAVSILACHPDFASTTQATFTTLNEEGVSMFKPCW